MGEKISPGVIRKTVEATEVGINCADVCPRCGWKVVSRDGLIVLDCEVCGENLISFGKPKQVQVEVELV